MPVLGTDLAIHLGIELGINLAGAGGGPVPPVLEAPELVPGMKAWFDSRSATYFALGGGGEVSTWMSRAGSLGAIAWTQGTAANQPIRVPSEPLMNNMPAVLWDGVNDWFVTSNQVAWAFMHNGAGGGMFRVFRMDATGGATQYIFANNSNVGHSGVQLFSTATLQTWRISNTIASPLEDVVSPVLAHSSRGVSKWQILGLDSAVTMHMRASGATAAPEVMVNAPSLATPTAAARLGATTSGTQPFKGLIVQDIYYDHVPTAPEQASLTAWAASIYGVAA